MRFQVENGQLEVVRLFAVNNESKPPKTQMNDHNFEFYLPEGAKIAQAMAKTAERQPAELRSRAAEPRRTATLSSSRCVPAKRSSRCSTQLPYSGQPPSIPKPSYGMQHFVVMIPKTMQFEPGPGAHFESMKDPQQADATVQVASLTPSPASRSASRFPARACSRRTRSRRQHERRGHGRSQASGPRQSGPGGGMGPPIDAPDPLQKYRWWIIGGFVARAGWRSLLRNHAPETQSHG